VNLTDGLDSHCENMRTMEAVPREAGWLHFQEGCCPVHENHSRCESPSLIRRPMSRSARSHPAGRLACLIVALSASFDMN